jgi:CRP-like cAMP-binding protein
LCDHAFREGNHDRHGSTSQQIRHEQFGELRFFGNSRVEEDLIDQLFNSSEKRLARLLPSSRELRQRRQAEPIVGKFSQETLAEMIGPTRSRVSNFMNKFRDLGFISYSGSSIEVQSALLSVLLNDKPQIRRDDAIDAE